MKRLEINVNGEAYPCTPLPGAMLRFKEQTGREVTEMDQNSFTDLCTYLYCCVAAASNREHKPFDMTLMDFADNLALEDLQAWSKAMVEQMTAEAEKKSRPTTKGR